MTNGGWRLSYVGSALVVSSGLVFYANKKPKGLGLDDILELIKEHPMTGYYEKRLRRRITLGDALSQERFSELGHEKEMVSSIDLIRQTHDRNFKKLPQTGRQLLSHHYNSTPKKTTKDT